MVDTETNQDDNSDVKGQRCSSLNGLEQLELMVKTIRIVCTQFFVCLTQPPTGHAGNENWHLPLHLVNKATIGR